MGCVRIIDFFTTNRDQTAISKNDKVIFSLSRFSDRVFHYRPHQGQSTG